MGLLIPWAFGWTPGINVMLTRMFFWYFGHPLVYFWIMGAYIIWYNIIPTALRRQRFQRRAHAPHVRHADAALDTGRNPSPVYGARHLADVENATHRHHVRRRDSVVHHGVCHLRIVRALRDRAGPARVHRRPSKRCPGTTRPSAARRWGCCSSSWAASAAWSTPRIAWTPSCTTRFGSSATFHVTVGGPVALTFLGAAYWLIPRLTGRALWKPDWALFQTRLWFFGMLIMSLSMHFAGLLGAPRRTAEVAYMGAAAAQRVAAVHAAGRGRRFFLFLSIVAFVAVAIGTLVQNEKTRIDRAERLRRRRRARSRRRPRCSTSTAGASLRWAWPSLRTQVRWANSCAIRDISLPGCEHGSRFQCGTIQM